jgi:hypothetical protein
LTRANTSGHRVRARQPDGPSMTASSFGLTSLPTKRLEAWSRRGPSSDVFPSSLLLGLATMTPDHRPSAPGPFGHRLALTQRPARRPSSGAGPLASAISRSRPSWVASP